jgi:hypothetical protein
MRRLWPKYDIELEQKLSTIQLILKFIEQAFKDQGLSEEYIRGRTRQNAK